MSFSGSGGFSDSSKSMLSGTTACTTFGLGADNHAIARDSKKNSIEHAHTKACQWRDLFTWRIGAGIPVSTLLTALFDAQPNQFALHHPCAPRLSPS